MVDDVPFGGSSGADTFVPDFDPGDLQRIEVLRGPQGSLYGASSVGLWRPSDALSVKVNAFYQVIKGDGTSDVTPNPPPGVGAPSTLGDLQQYYIRGIGPYDRRAEAYSAVINYKVGSLDLTSLTGFNRYRINDNFDYTFALGPLSEQQFGQIGTPILNAVGISRVTQELRLASPLGQHFDLLVGFFFSSAYLLADLISNRSPAVDPAPYTPTR